MQSYGSTSPSLPVNYYAPLSQRSTVENGYNILDQTQQSHNMNTYPDFHQGTHDPSMMQQRALAQQRAQTVIGQMQQQAQPQATPSYLQIPNNMQAVTAFVASMAPQLIAMGAMQVSPQQQNAAIPTDPWPMPQQSNPLRNDIRTDILNHLAKGNVHIHSEESDEPEIIDMMDPIAIYEDARIWGDPHFVGADGGKFDVQGEAGKIYNILSDKDLQLNAEFIAWGGNGATAIGRSGITLGNDQIDISKDGTLLINDTEYSDNGIYLNDQIEKLGNNIFVRSDEYDMEFITKGSHMDIYFDSNNAVSDNVLPQGLWGGTVDGDALARNGDTGAGAQGGGGIMTLDGTMTDAGDTDTVKLYELDNIFNNDFTNFNSFFS